jgi:hypothetical protein
MYETASFSEFCKVTSESVLRQNEVSFGSNNCKFQEFMIPLSSALLISTRGGAVYVRKSFIFTAILFIQVCNLCEQTGFVTSPTHTLRSEHRMDLLKLQIDRVYTVSISEDKEVIEPL